MTGPFVACSTKGEETTRHESLEDAKRWQELLRGVIKQAGVVVVEAIA